VAAERAEPAEPEAFSVPYRVRFDEAAPDGLVRTSSLLRYAQDVAWHHSEARGYDRGWYAARGLAWLVRTAEVTVSERIPVGSGLTGTTRVVGWRRVWARRRTTFEDGQGRLAATIQIDWVLLDSRGSPTRIPAEFEPVFGTVETSVALARVALGEAPPEARRSEIAVRPQELDPMAHVNNAVYADWLDEAITSAGHPDATRAIPRVMRLEYAAAADAGSKLASVLWKDGEDWSFRLLAPGGAEVLRARLETAER
jgi:acyl-ACP thioesterase